jgi:N-methylhydantoinase B
VLTADGAVDEAATAELREQLRSGRGELSAFDFGEPAGKPERFDASAV